MNRCLEVSSKIQRGLLPRSHDCLKPPDEQMFGCFTQHQFLLRSNAYLKLTDGQMFGCLPKIKSDFLLRSNDCLKPPDEQMFGCFTQHQFLLRSNAFSKNATLLKSSLSFLARQYYRRRRLRVVKIYSSGGFDQSYTLIRTVVKTSKHLFIHRF